MTDTQQQPSAADIAKIRNNSATAIVVHHSDAAERWALSDERTVVFSVVRPNPAREVWEGMEHGEGDEAPPGTIQVDYTMPATPNAGLSLIYLRRARENADLAMSWLIELALGTEGYDALAEELAGYEDGMEAQIVLNSVVARIQRVAMGGLEGKV